ncbi:hypothetical protein Btru_071411 [Bulinus truncatus]|nr:hypothetical protein Btru_071411 [Bulinus truncatus]
MPSSSPKLRVTSDSSISALLLDIVILKLLRQPDIYLDLADILLNLYKKGVKLRIITDKDQLYSSGSQIWNLRKEGIPVRVNDNSYLMHHKFVIVDGKILINGSFNWTYQAITGNEENVIITDDPAVTDLFTTTFKRLWNEYEKQLTAAEEHQISSRQSRNRNL